MARPVVLQAMFVIVDEVNLASFGCVANYRAQASEIGIGTISLSSPMRHCVTCFFIRRFFLSIADCDK